MVIVRPTPHPLKIKLLELGMKQVDVSYSAKINISTLNRVLAGREKPSKEVQKKLDELWKQLTSEQPTNRAA